MQVKSQHANTIKTYIDSHPDARIGEWPIEIGGENRKKALLSSPDKIDPL